MRRRVIALVLLFAVTPVASELLEWGIHAVTHGDFAHAGDSSHETGLDEHGCTPLFHTCGCHRGAAATEACDKVALAPLALLGANGLPDPAVAGNRPAEPPPLRPPIA